ncbi:hypothetical protein NZ30_05905 [Xanthomonas translucens pv. undulosa]|nr:hypothetical protein NZ30_05905 [Xanthomonas translucens pv. undulosa]
MHIRASRVIATGHLLWTIRHYRFLQSRVFQSRVLQSRVLQFRVFQFRVFQFFRMIFECQ